MAVIASSSVLPAISPFLSTPAFAKGSFRILVSSDDECGFIVKHTPRTD